MNNKKAQGAFEYILLVAGVLLIVVITFVVLKGIPRAGESNIQESTLLAFQNAKTWCLNWCGEGAWDYINATAGYDPICTDAHLMGASAGSTAYLDCVYQENATEGCNATIAEQYGGQAIKPRNTRACAFFVG